MDDSWFGAGPAPIERRLRERLDEPARGRIQLVAGPRQVGKTTLLLDLAKSYGDRATYVAADAPETHLPGYWERVWSTAESRAARGKTIVLLDEIHLLPNWATVLKAQWDRIKRQRLPNPPRCHGIVGPERHARPSRESRRPVRANRLRTVERDRDC